MGFWKPKPVGSALDRGGRACAAEGLQDVTALRGQVLAVLQDCRGPRAEALRTRLLRANHAQDLWIARSEVYQLVATQHCETQAMSRINGLLPAFRQCLPAHSLGNV